jgi:toxin ParE1/3/4
MQVRFTETALIEINKILSYIAERNPLAAKKVRARVDMTLAALADFPQMAQAADEPGVRRMPITSYPYVIFYTIEADKVVILHVRHAARRAPWDKG